MTDASGVKIAEFGEFFNVFRRAEPRKGPVFRYDKPTPYGNAVKDFLSTVLSGAFVFTPKGLYSKAQGKRIATLG